MKKAGLKRQLATNTCTHRYTRTMTNIRVSMCIDIYLTTRELAGLLALYDRYRSLLMYKMHIIIISYSGNIRRGNSYTRFWACTFQNYYTAISHHQLYNNNPGGSGRIVPCYDNLGYLHVLKQDALREGPGVACSLPDVTTVVALTSSVKRHQL